MKDKEDISNKPFDDTSTIVIFGLVIQVSVEDIPSIKDFLRAKSKIVYQRVSSDHLYIVDDRRAVAE